MVEYLNAYDISGELVKTAERSSLMHEIKQYSYLHNDAPLALPTVFMFLQNRLGELYIVQRGDKDEDPYMYDKTVGGHVAADETYRECLQRESQEEIGVEVIIAEEEEYPGQVKRVDLNKYALVRAIGVDNWRKSVRKERDGRSWVKRWREIIYAGRYNGPVRYNDGEAINCRLMSSTALGIALQKNPQYFTHDLRFLFEKYRGYLDG